MARSPDQRTTLDTRALAFVLERVTYRNARIRVTGHWTGARGRRFIRPSLTALGAEAGTRVLADLADKPWSPEGAGTWRAEFAWEGPLEGIEAFELDVAPGVRARIPVPDRSDTAAGSRRSPPPLPAASPPPVTTAPSPSDADGPWFEDLEVGQRRRAPAVTLTTGMAALHQAIVGERSVPILDQRLAHAVFGTVPAPPGLVVNLSIGQSSVFTRRVRANLFYRGLQLHRLPALGDTLSTETEVVALRQNRPRAGRPATGLAVVHVRTVDGDGRRVLQYERCAMLPLRDPTGRTAHADDVAQGEAGVDLEAAAALAGGWDLATLREVASGPLAVDLSPGDRWAIRDGDPVTSAPELARLTLNLAAVHYDPRATGSGHRLVFGGHTVALAATQAGRVLPGLAAVVAWVRCEHTAPVREDDLLMSTLTVEEISPLPRSGALVTLRSVVSAERDGERTDVLDWRFVAAVA